MKKSLGIYGDSYGSTAPPSFRNLKLAIGHTVNEVDEFWATDQRLQNEYDITNYSVPGTDFLYCYHKFVDTHHNYDKIVFIVTNSVRLGFTYKDKYFRFSNINDVPRNLLNCEDWFPGLEEPVRIVNSVSDYFNYMVNIEFTDAAQAKLIEIMQANRKQTHGDDIIIIYAFQNKFIADSSANLFDISEREIDIISDRPMFFAENLDLRNAHMCRENNKIFADYILERLAGSKQILDYEKFGKISQSELDLYFRSPDLLKVHHDDT